MHAVREYNQKQIQDRDARARVLVVDDHPAIREALGDAIERNVGLTYVGGAASASEAFSLLTKSPTDVAIIDVALGDADGLDLIQNLRAQFPDLRVVVFSMYDELIYAERAIRAGAAGYVMKNVPTTTIIEAIRCVLRGDIYLSRHMASRMLTRIASPGRARPDRHAALDVLTDRELSVVQMMGQGYTVDKVAQRLHLSRKTVETYRRRAKEKMGFDSVTELLQFAVRWTYGQSSQ